MSFNANIPQPTQTANISQGDLLNNFQALAPLISGVLTFVPQVDPPDLSGTDIFQFARTSTSTSDTEMCIEKTSGSIIEYTAGSVSGSAGWSRFPSNLLIVWRIVTSYNFSMSGNYSFTYSSISGFPGFDPADSTTPTSFVTVFGNNFYSPSVNSTSNKTTLVISAANFGGGVPGIGVGFCWISFGRGPTT